MSKVAVSLTQNVKAAGCAAKLGPADLAQILHNLPTFHHPDVIVGTETNDDAGVFRLRDDLAIVNTVDFFTPIVDDPYTFGRIAATNALSDVYAMGGRPIFALALLGMPLDRLPLETIRRITAGGESACAGAGIPVAGGHSIDTVEPIYGLAVLGLAHPDKVMRNHSARSGDAIVLGKPLGVGILSAALKQGKLSEAGYAEMIACTTRLNTPGIGLAEMPGVHALTDVTGFGLAGHLLEMCRGAGLRAELRWSGVPILPEALGHARAGVFTGASTRNWSGYGAEVTLARGIEKWQQQLLTDPQTSGGLLVACAPEAEQEVLSLFAREGFGEARRIGRFATGAPGLAVTA